MTEEWITELDELYLARDWRAFAKQYAAWYLVSSDEHQLMLLRRLRTCWCHTDCMLAVTKALDLKLN